MLEDFTRSLTGSDRRSASTTGARGFLQRFESISPSLRFGQFSDAWHQFCPGIHVAHPDSSKGETGALDSGILNATAIILVADRHEIAARTLQRLAHVQPVCHPRPNRGFPLVVRGDTDRTVWLRSYRCEDFIQLDADAFSAGGMRLLMFLAFDSARASSNSLVQHHVYDGWMDYQCHFQRSQKRYRFAPDALQELIHLGSLYLLGNRPKATFLDQGREERWSIMCQIMLWIAQDLEITLPPQVVRT